MYRELRDAQRHTESLRIAVREVNMANRYVIGEDAHGAQIQVTLDLLDPLLTIPALGEVWTVRRRGLDWLLDRRLETGSELVKPETLLPGDKRVEAANHLYLVGKKVEVDFGDGVLYTEDGALKYRGANGTITTLGPA